MNRLSSALALRDAEKRGVEDAQRGLPSDPAPFLDAYFTKEPVFNPVENPLDQQLNTRMAYTVEVEALHVEVEELDVALAQHSSPSWLLIAIVFLLFVDVEANVTFFRQDGFTGVPLFILSLGLAVVLFVLTYQLAKCAREQHS
jgi:hypothetical protein